MLLHSLFFSHIYQEFFSFFFFVGSIYLSEFVQFLQFSLVLLLYFTWRFSFHCLLSLSLFPFLIPSFLLYLLYTHRGTRNFLAGAFVGDYVTVHNGDCSFRLVELATSLALIPLYWCARNDGMCRHNTSTNSWAQRATRATFKMAYIKPTKQRHGTRTRALFFLGYLISTFLLHCCFFYYFLGRPTGLQTIRCIFVCLIPAHHPPSSPWLAGPFLLVYLLSVLRLFILLSFGFRF